MVVGDGQGEHEDGHEEEAHELDREPTHVVDECHCEPVPWHGAAERNEGLRSCNVIDLFDGAHRFSFWDPSHGAEDILLEEIGAVERNVEEEPRAGGTEEVESMAMEELLGKEAKGIGGLLGHVFNLVKNIN